MANFKTHFAAAAAVSGAASSGLLALNHIGSTEAIVAFALGTVGGFLPDVDSDNSKPVSITFNAVAIVVSFLVMFSKSSTYSVAEMLLLWVIVYLLVRLALLKSFQHITVHRGMFHSIPAALLAGVLAANLMSYGFGVTGLLGWIYGSFVTMGYLLHLLLDEMVSVNLMGRRIKRSFGTALKLYDPKNWLVTLLVYVGLIMALLVSPENHGALALFNEQNLLSELRNIMLPQGQWFADLI